MDSLNMPHISSKPFSWQQQQQLKRIPFCEMGRACRAAVCWTTTTTSRPGVLAHRQRSPLHPQWASHPAIHTRSCPPPMYNYVHGHEAAIPRAEFEPTSDADTSSDASFGRTRRTVEPSKHPALSVQGGTAGLGEASSSKRSVECCV